MTSTQRFVISILALSAFAVGQSFNIDVGVVTGAGAGAPSAIFGAAAQTQGTWNNITGTTTGPFPLVNLAGAATAVTLMRSSGTGGGFAFNNANTTGNFELLLDDGHDVGGAAATVTWTVSGLAAGTYTVYTYAVAPDSGTFLTNVSATGSPSPNPQTVGGVIPSNSFMIGITHSVHVITVAAAANLVIVTATSSGFGTVNGFQICDSYSLTLFQDGPLAPLSLNNNCGEPNSPYYNIATLTAGSFPNGPLFGLDMTIQDALNQIAAGPPFSGLLDANGQATFLVPGIPPNITIYLVSATVGSLSSTVKITAPFSYTTM